MNVIKKIQQGEEFPLFKLPIIMYSVSVCISLAHYFLAKRYRFLALHYAELQTINLLVIIFEV